MAAPAPVEPTPSKRAQLRVWAVLFPFLPLPQLLARRLYLRIWLAVVLGVALLMVLVAWAWQAAVEHYAMHPPAREWVVRDGAGQELTRITAHAQPGQPLVLDIPGSEKNPPLQLFIERRLEPGAERWRSMGPPGPPPPYARNVSLWWVRSPFGFAGMLALLGLVTALVLYPVVRRLTQRLERLQQGVQRWGEGDLSVRMPESGDDEVADLSRRFNAAAQRIGDLMAAQKSLLANASHELRSPLARIRMGLELLDAPTASAAMRARTREEILRNMVELDQLIDEILLASRLDARQADLGTVERVDWVGLCAEECARVGALLEVENGIQALEVKGVLKLMRRMVRNLLENALRYGAQPGRPDTVVLHVGLRAGAPCLRVCDQGPGVPQAYRQRIFEPFFRLPGASEAAGGTGLGLALVKSIAERHGWAVRCEDQNGAGACFVVQCAGPGEAVHSSLQRRSV